jgi:hypothetical protein
MAKKRSHSFTVSEPQLLNLGIQILYINPKAPHSTLVIATWLRPCTPAVFRLAVEQICAD